MLWLIFILLFPALVAAAQVEPAPIDTDGKDVVLPTGKSTSQGVAAQPGDNRTTMTFTRDAFSDPTQTVVADVWSLIAGNWVRVCAATFPGIDDSAERQKSARLRCNLHGGTETKVDLTLTKGTLDTKVNLVTTQAAQTAFIAPLHHSVAFDNADTVSGSGVSTLTLAGFVVAATDPLILVGVAEDDTNQSTSGVTFNSVSMVQIGTDQDQGGGYNLGIYRLTANSGTHDVVATFTSSIGNGALGAMSFTGVDQASPVGTREESISFDGSPISITVPTNGLAADFVAAIAGTNGCLDSMSTASGNTERLEDCVNDEVIIAASTRDTTGAFTWDSISGAYAFQLGVPINASVAATSTVTRRRFAQ